MKKYDVYAVGNALVDFEVEVSDEEIERLGVERGVMTLIDEERHLSLMEHLHGTRHKRACGGSAANSIIAVAQLGGKACYSCRVADDDHGDFFLEDLKSHGVDANHKTTRPTGNTGKCVVMITPDADRSMNTYLGVTGDLGEDCLDVQAICNSNFVYIEGYLVSAPLALEAAIEAKRLAKEASVKIAFSLSDPSMVEFFREGMNQLLDGGVDLLFCNEDEALEYTHCTELDGAVKALKLISKQFVVTLGSKGALIWDGDTEIKISAHKVDAVDTTGAGDMFAGAFMLGLCQNLDMESAGNLACFASAQVVSRFGPRLVETETEVVINYVEQLKRKM